MARPCPRCRSRAIKHDRSLGGRAVCGRCGLPVGSPWHGRINRLEAQWHGVCLAVPSIRVVLAWVLPLGLMAGMLHLTANPSGTIPSLPAPSPSGQDSR